jgi:hypothetical protein
MATFDLRISFTGLCFWLVENGKLWVLMPETHDHGPSEERHVAKLMYDRAYERAHQSDLSRDIACKDLARRDLAFVGPAPLSLRLPSEILPLDAHHGKVAVSLLGSAPDARLRTRIRLASGCICWYDPGIVWEVSPGSGEHRRLTYRVEWVIRNIEGEPLPAFDLSGFDGGTTQTVGPLYPIGDTIHLDIMHVPVAQLPRARVQTSGATGHHAQLYKSLTSAGGAPVQLAPVDGQLFNTECEPGTILALGAEPIECMHGGGDLP